MNIETPNLFKSRLIKIASGLLVMALLVGGYYFIANRLGHAATAIDYVAAAPTAAVDAARAVTDPMPNSCVNQSVLIGNNPTAQPICVYHAKDFTFGTYNTCIVIPYGGGCAPDPRFVIGLPGDPKMYQVNGMTPSNDAWIASPLSNTLFFSQWSLSAFAVFDLVHHITPSVAADGSTVYTYDNATTYSLSGLDELGGSVKINGSGVSANGEWAAFEMVGYGLVRVHLTDFQYTLYSTSVAQYGFGVDPHYNFAISNDGRFITDFGGNLPTEVYDLTACGDSQVGVRSYWHNNQPVANMCKSRSLDSIIATANGGGTVGNQLSSNVYFSTDAGQLFLIAQPYVNSSNVVPKWVTITAAGYVVAGTGGTGTGTTGTGTGTTAEQEKEDAKKESERSSHYLPKEKADGVKKEAKDDEARRGYPYKPTVIINNKRS